MRAGHLRRFVQKEGKDERKYEERDSGINRRDYQPRSRTPKCRVHRGRRANGPPKRIIDTIVGRFAEKELRNLPGNAMLVVLVLSTLLAKESAPWRQ